MTFILKKIKKKIVNKILFDVKSSDVFGFYFYPLQEVNFKNDIQIVSQ